MSNNPSIAELMKAGVHFGHKKSKWHPKMEPFIFAEKNGIHIINLEETQRKLTEALNFAVETVSAGGTILFLGTKKQAQAIVKNAALDCGMPYIVSRWLGGTLTNANTVLGLIKRYNKMKDDKANGRLSRYTKKERLQIDRQIEKLDTLIGGLADMSKIPEAVFIVDIREEKTALLESNKKGVPVIALCDSNVNPEKTQYPIPANDDAINSIKLIVETMAAAIKEAKKSVPAVSPAVKAKPAVIKRAPVAKKAPAVEAETAPVAEK